MNGLGTRRFSSALCALALGTLCVAGPALAQDDGRGLGRRESERRFALVVGYDAYTGAPLRNAVRDARALATKLDQLGFQVTRLEDTSLRDLERGVQDWATRLGPGDVGLFFYAGHGIQVEGINYLVPVDFDAVDEIDAKYEAFAAERVLERMQASGSRLNIVILDACRDNPFRASRGGTRGLAQMQTGRGSFLAFATSPGDVASDNPGGRNGLFTSHLLRALDEPDLGINDVFDRTRTAVYDSSNERQLPWISSSVIGTFVFNPSSPPADPPPDPAPAETPPPSGSELKTVLERAEEHAQRREQWRQWLSKMKAAAAGVEDIEAEDVPPQLKADAWRSFLADFSADDPFSQEDENLRARARSRLTHWQETPTPPPPDKRADAAPPTVETKTLALEGTGDWSVTIQGRELNYRAAQRYCGDLVLGGHDDWGLPPLMLFERYLWAPGETRDCGGIRCDLVTSLDLTRSGIWIASRPSDLPPELARNPDVISELNGEPLAFDVQSGELWVYAAGPDIDVELHTLCIRVDR